MIFLNASTWSNKIPGWFDYHPTVTRYMYRNFVGVLGCSFLKLLNVEGCPGITAVGVAAVVQGCPHMKEFKVGSREEEDEDDEDDNDDDDDDNDD